MIVLCDCFDCDAKCEQCVHAVEHSFTDECMKRYCKFSMVIVECVKVSK